MTLADKLLALHGDPESTAYGNDDLWQAAAKLREMERNERRTALASVGAAAFTTWDKRAVAQLNADIANELLRPAEYGLLISLLQVIERRSDLPLVVAPSLSARLTRAHSLLARQP